MPNRLIDETSPYLLQHANNPVDWYPWGTEAFERAKSEQKPVLLSIGYSACHWCHVMERESFENEAIAAQMNAEFVSIKVDREERPDLDSIYMQAVQALTGRGGWPMTVFLTPEKQPFYGGTYFPPEDRHSMPGFPRVLTAIADAYKNSQEDVLKAANDLTNAIQSAVLAPSSNEGLSEDLLHDSVEALSRAFDKTYGGFGQAPKFPQPMPLEFLIAYSDRYRDADSLEIVCKTLNAMARGGIYDQLGGGFHRYSTDAQWLTPHFEKMLYDNGLVTQLYLKAYQLTGITTYRNIVEETLDYMLREMRHSQGGFYSSQDADTDGEEGKYYVWKTSDILSNFEERDVEILSGYFGVTPEGNFEGSNILTTTMDPPDVAAALGMAEQEFQAELGRIKSDMLALRGKRTPPPTDRKILTSWNGMVLKALADAALILDSKRYKDAAIENASFLLQELYIDGRLCRTWKDGASRLKGYLEDYAYLILGLISLHELTFSHRWLYEAERLTEEMVRLFWDEEKKVLFDVGDDHEVLLLRPRELFDNAMASGNSIAAEALYRMATITGNAEHLRKTKLLLESAISFMKVYPLGFGHWLKVLTMYLSDNVEIAIVGQQYDGDLKSLVRVVATKFLSNRTFLGRLLDQENDFPSPLLIGKGGKVGIPTAYLCHEYVCEEPTSDASTLLHQLETRVTLPSG